MMRMHGWYLMTICTVLWEGMQELRAHLLASSGEGISGPVVVDAPEGMLALELQSGRCLILDWSCRHEWGKGQSEESNTAICGAGHRHIPARCYGNPLHSP